MPGPTTTATQTTPKAKASAAREPRAGDAVLFRPWTQMTADRATHLHAVVAQAVDHTLNISALMPSGTWSPFGNIPYDPTGGAPGSWRWPDA